MFRLHTIARRTLARHIQTNNTSVRVTNSLPYESRTHDTFRLHTIAHTTLGRHIQTNNTSVRVTNSLYIYIYIYTYMYHKWVKNMFWLHTAALKAIRSKVTPSPGGGPIYYVPPWRFSYLLCSPRGGFLLTMFQNQVPRGRGPPSGHLVQIFPGRSLSSSGCLIRKNCK